MTKKESVKSMVLEMSAMWLCFLSIYTSMSIKRNLKTHLTGIRYNLRSHPYRLKRLWINLTILYTINIGAIQMSYFIYFIFIHHNLLYFNYYIKHLSIFVIPANRRFNIPAQQCEVSSLQYVSAVCHSHQEWGMENSRLWLCNTQC